MTFTNKNMVYNPVFTREELQDKFSHLRKLKYNQFRWWRMYESTVKPLIASAPLRDRIANGEYDFPHYWYQAAWCEHEINDLYQRYEDDHTQYLEKVAIWKARRTKLLEDHDKEEKYKMDSLVKEFSLNFHITKDEVIEEMANFGGDLVKFYDYISNHPTYKLKAEKTPRLSFKKRGRPKKITI